MAIETEAALRDLIPEPPARAWEKEQDFLSVSAAAFVAASPFAVLATSSADGRCDASPRGGPPGFVLMLDPRRIAIPDYRGNRRQDSHRNLLENPNVGLVFMVPGIKETLRVNGTATLSTEPAVLKRLATKGDTPKLALDIAIETVFMHCGKAPVRSQIWDPETWAPEKASGAAILSDARGGTEEETRAYLDAAYADPEQVW